MTRMNLDIKTMITWLIVTFGAGGAWWTMDTGVKDMRADTRRIRVKLDSITVALNGIVMTDSLQGRDIRELRLKIDEHIERDEP